MKNPIRLAVLCSLFSFAFEAYAYSTYTHAEITYEAMKRTKLTTDQELLFRLGLTERIEKNRAAPFLRSNGFDSYITTVDSKLKFMPGDEKFEVDQLKLLNLRLGVPKDSSMSTWVMRGAIREDDNSIENPASDEPGGVFQRVFSHFYDPYHDKALHVVRLLGAKAADWTFQDGAESRESALSLTWRTNLFNYSAAREAQWSALTGLNKSGQDATPEQDSAQPKSSARNAHWATTFRIVGNMVHLLQDMAQPQHTRNDKHAGLYCLGVMGCPFTGHDSFYEKYIESRTLRATQFSLYEGFFKGTPGESMPTNQLKLDYGTYPTPAFSRLSDFFAGRAGSETQPGTGLADYSNRFYSFGTNLNRQSNDFPSPPPDGLGLGTETLDRPENMNGERLEGKLVFYTGTVEDKLFEIPSGQRRLSSVGVWDQALQSKNIFGLSSTTLNYFNYNDQASLLIPRAISYSAGFVDHFFRGKLEISAPDDGIYSIIDHADDLSSKKDEGGFYKLKLKIKNISVDLNGALLMDSAGEMRAIAKFHRNNCYTPTLSGEYGAPNQDWKSCRGAEEEIVVSDKINAPTEINGGGKTVTFTFQSRIPINATDLFIQVAYRGKLGEDNDAIVVGIKDISEPTYISNFSTADQFRYSHYFPVIAVDQASTAMRSYEEWCMGDTPASFNTFDDCRMSTGKHKKIRWHAAGKFPIGYDPSTSTLAQDRFHFIAEQPEFFPVVKMSAPTGTMNRVAILMDLQPTFSGIYIEETVDTQIHNNPEVNYSPQFLWNVGGAPAPTINQVDPGTGLMVTSVQYKLARGIYIRSDNDLIGYGVESPPLILKTSEIDFLSGQ